MEALERKHAEQLQSTTLQLSQALQASSADHFRCATCMYVRVMLDVSLRKERPWNLLSDLSNASLNCTC